MLQDTTGTIATSVPRQSNWQDDFGLIFQGPRIAAVTGHSSKDVEAILDDLGCDIQLAETAVLKLDARTKL